MQPSHWELNRDKVSFLICHQPSMIGCSTCCHKGHVIHLLHKETGWEFCDPDRCTYTLMMEDVYFSCSMKRIVASRGACVHTILNKAFHVRYFKFRTIFEVLLPTSLAIPKGFRRSHSSSASQNLRLIVTLSDEMFAALSLKTVCYKIIQQPSVLHMENFFGGVTRHEENLPGRNTKKKSLFIDFGSKWPYKSPKMTSKHPKSAKITPCDHNFAWNYSRYAIFRCFQSGKL